MDIPQSQVDRLEELVANTKCMKGHACRRSDLEKLSEVDRVADSVVLFCRDKDARPCGHSMLFGRSTLCTCPIRIYLAKCFAK